MTPFPWPDALVIVGLVVLNGLFSMSELAIVSARPARMKVLAEAGACVAIVRATAPATRVEISGGVTLATVADYARTGADLISTSAITQSAPALDLGLDVAPGAVGPIGG